jgi:phosphoglycerate dehydrogenase-like enzyme
MSKTIVTILATGRDGVRLPAGGGPFPRAIAARERLRDAVEVRFASVPGDTSAVRDTEIIACGNVPAEVLAAAPKLKWISFWASGLDGRLTPDMKTRGLLVTNAAGIHGPNIAEHIIGYMLMFTRRFGTYARAQHAHTWVHHEEPAEELSGQTLGIVGLGATGRALAVRARSFGMQVLATKRDIGSGGDVVDELFTPSQLATLVRRSDHVAITAPYTEETHRLFDEQMLASMKPTAYLYNTSRGTIVDEAALITVLREGRLRGAGMDVFETEPLPSDSPLWDMPNVIVTPHAAGFTPYYFPRASELFADNLERYLDGRPLENLYDWNLGYSRVTVSR